MLGQGVVLQFTVQDHFLEINSQLCWKYKEKTPEESDTDYIC